MQTAEMIRKAIEELNERLPDSIGQLFGFELLNADEVQNTYLFSCQTKPWMTNAFGTLHGGMSASIVDQAMGFVVYGLMTGEGIAPTAQMQMSYLAPLTPGEDVLVSVHAVSRGSTLLHMTAEIRRADASNRLCIAANAIYCILRQAK